MKYLEISNLCEREKKVCKARPQEFTSGQKLDLISIKR